MVFIWDPKSNNWKEAEKKHQGLIKKLWSNNCSWTPLALPGAVLTQHTAIRSVPRWGVITCSGGNSTQSPRSSSLNLGSSAYPVTFKENKNVFTLVSSIKGIVNLGIKLSNHHQKKISFSVLNVCNWEVPSLMLSWLGKSSHMGIRMISAITET